MKTFLMKPERFLFPTEGPSNQNAFEMHNLLEMHNEDEYKSCFLRNIARVNALMLKTRTYIIKWGQKNQLVFPLNEVYFSDCIGRYLFQNQKAFAKQIQILWWDMITMLSRFKLGFYSHRNNTHGKHSCVCVMHCMHVFICDYSMVCLNTGLWLAGRYAV